MTHITTEIDEEPLLRLAYNLGVVNINFVGGEEMFSADVYLIFLNGAIIGITENHHQLVKVFRMMRRKGLINQFVSIYPQHHLRYFYLNQYKIKN